ncbi:unnamed protein product, partial [Allacma fusca]
IHRFL